MDFRKYGLRSVRLGENKMKAVNKGFTLIELMIVVAVIGVLAAIAVPQYQNYVAKAELGSALSTLASLKTNVEDQLARDGTFPTAASNTDATEKLGAPKLVATTATITATPDSATKGAGSLVYTLVTGSEKVAGATVTLARDGDAVWKCTVSGTKITDAMAPKGCSKSST
ncbi:fimbrial protein [Plesiomonas shigelloides 302-73]|uniref:Fimbrial protein n=2 Tax=Plesiomonas shigelloides TaxID=703 RepID=R8AT45_PLESH|nr:fimbrial protein [Plesiomonas shigelloides 302-73]